MSQPMSDAALDQLFRTARTYTHFLDKPVSAAQLEEIWELMKFGPTSANMLPARLVWCTSDDAQAKLAALSSGNNAAKIAKAPVCVIIAMDFDFAELMPELYPPAPGMKDLFDSLPAAEREAMALRNSSLQGAYLILAARALGLDCGPMSGFDNAAVDAAFFADTPHVKSNFISTLGYGDPAGLHPRLPRPGFGRFNTIL